MKFNFQIYISISFLFKLKNVFFDPFSNQAYFLASDVYPKVQLKLLMGGG